MNVLLLALKDIDLSGFAECGGVTIVRFAAAAEASAALGATADAVVVVSDGCSEELRTSLAAAIAKLDCRVIEVQGDATADHGDPLSAACTAVIAAFGVAAGVSAAIAALRA